MHKLLIANASSLSLTIAPPSHETSLQPQCFNLSAHHLSWATVADLGDECAGDGQGRGSHRQSLRTFTVTYIGESLFSFAGKTNTRALGGKDPREGCSTLTNESSEEAQKAGRALRAHDRRFLLHMHHTSKHCHFLSAADLLQERVLTSSWLALKTTIVTSTSCCRWLSPFIWESGSRRIVLRAEDSLITHGAQVSIVLNCHTEVAVGGVFLCQREIDVLFRSLLGTISLFVGGSIGHHGRYPTDCEYFLVLSDIVLLFFMCICTCVQVPEEARKRFRIPWNWSDM